MYRSVRAEQNKSGNESVESNKWAEKCNGRHGFPVYNNVLMACKHGFKVYKTYLWALYGNYNANDQTVLEPVKAS